MNPYIHTASGGCFDLIPDTRLEDFREPKIEDIAHALSHICRFTGHTSVHYSVAEHSYRASFCVPEDFALEALLHDASEAYLGDVSSPLKSLLPDYRVIERMLEKRIAEVFDVPFPMSPCVKLADLQMVATEMRDLLPPSAYEEMRHDVRLRDIRPLYRTITPMLPQYARTRFLERYQQLIYRRRRQAERLAA